MIPPLIAKGDAGTDRPLVIDGIVLSVMPRDMGVTPEPVSEYQDMLDGGAREWQRRPHFDGIANHSDRYTVTVPYEHLKGDNRAKMELIRVRGGIHRLTIWRMVPVVWTCRAGVQRYYFPRFRKVAAHLYAGLDIGNGYFVSTDLFPTLATLNGDELDVTYAEGPTLADPGAGNVVIARQPDASGGALDYTALRLGDVVATGDDLELWSCFTMECSMRAPSIRMVGNTESHAYTFVEV